MPRAIAFYRSLVGKKVIMAVTGVLLFLFIVEHLVGNLLIFLGPKAFNDYAAFLKSTGELLWVARVVLLAALILHIWSAYQVTVAGWRARPVSYMVRKDTETNYAARTMIYSGPLIFLYVIYHLLMFTFLTTGPGYSKTDIYRNVVLAFHVPLIASVYIAAMLVLGFHLYHGTWSMLQTLGITYPEKSWLRWGLIPAVAVIIAAGFISIPVAVLAGVLA